MLQTSVEMVNPGGTGTPARLISARPAPLPPRVSFIFPSPSAVPPPKAYTYFFIAFLFSLVSLSTLRNDLRKIGDRGKLRQKPVQQRKPVPPHILVRRVDQNLVEEQIHRGPQPRDRLQLLLIVEIAGSDRAPAWRGNSSYRSRSPGRASSSASLTSPPPANCACLRMFRMRLKLAASGSKSSVGRTAWMATSRLSTSTRSSQPAASTAFTSSYGKPRTSRK